MDEPDDALEQLRRWEAHGGTWQVVAGGAPSGETVVALLRCDGGEQVDTVRGAGPRFTAYVRDAGDATRNP